MQEIQQLFTFTSEHTTKIIAGISVVATGFLTHYFTKKIEKRKNVVALRQPLYVEIDKSISSIFQITERNGSFNLLGRIPVSLFDKFKDDLADILIFKDKHYSILNWQLKRNFRQVEKTINALNCQIRQGAKMAGTFQIVLTGQEQTDLYKSPRGEDWARQVIAEKNGYAQEAKIQFNLLKKQLGALKRNFANFAT